MWALLWFVLVAAAVAVFAVLGLRLYRQARALGAELATASERLAEVSEVLQQVEQSTAAAEAHRTSRRPGPAQQRR